MNAFYALKTCKGHEIFTILILLKHALNTPFRMCLMLKGVIYAYGRLFSPQNKNIY